MTKAVNNALINFSTNTLLLVVTSAVSLWMTPYLIGKLGVEAYGVVPLFISILGYLGLFTSVLSSSVGTCVSLNYYKGDIDRANIYISSAFWGLIGISAFILIGSSVFSVFLSSVFNIPAGYENQARWLFILVIVTSVLSALNSLYGRSCFILHKFYWLDLFGILSKFLQVGVLLVSFTCFSASLSFVGWAAAASAFFALLLTATLDMFVLPELKINYGSFDFNACKEMIALGFGVSVNQFGALLYLSSDLILINIFLGSTATGQYGPIVQWAFLIRTLAGVVTRLFGPTVMEQIARNDFDSLKSQLFTLTKFLGLILGLPVCLVSGFSKPLLSLWLGADFVWLYKLMILLVLGQIVPYSLGTIFGIFRGLNKLKIPGIVTVIAGIANIILAIILIKYTRLGIYGAGIATLIAVFGKNVLFNISYLAKLLKFNSWKMWSAIVKGCLPATIFTILMLLFAQYVNINHFVKLAGYGLIFAILYAVSVYRLVLTRSDRMFALRVLKIDKFLSPQWISIITN